MEVFRIVSLLGILCWTVLEAKRCEQVDLCSCQFEDGTKIDITSLGNTDGTPRFKDVIAKEEGNFYSYNPCVGFTEQQCDDASVCILNPDKTESVQIGDSGKAGFKYDEASGDTVVAYTSGTLSQLKISEIVLKCDQSACEPSIVADGQIKGGAFQMTLTSVCGCAGGCSATGPNSCSSKGAGGGGLGIGSVLVIIFFVVLVLYVAAGITFNVVRGQARGSDIIPNKTFWAAVPGLVVQMTLTTVCACGDGCSSSGPNTSAREPGAED